MQVTQDEWAALREDVGYIKAKIEVLPSLDERVRDLEKKWWQFPAAGVLSALLAVFGITIQ